MVRKQLKGSTLVETLIAVMIISASLAIGLYSLARLDLLESTGKRTKVSLILKSYMEQTITEQRIFDEVVESELIAIRKEIISTSDPEVVIIKVEGILDDRILGIESRVVIMD